MNLIVLPRTAYIVFISFSESKLVNDPLEWASLLHAINDLRLLYISYLRIVWISWPVAERIVGEPDCACVVEFCAFLYVLVEGDMGEEKSLVSPQTLGECCLRLDFAYLEEVWRCPWSRGVWSFIKGNHIEEGRSSGNRIAV